MILITGATGYIGRHLVSRLVDRGNRPRCLVRDIDHASQILSADKVEFVQGDTTRPNSLAAAVQGIDTIVHAAFITADRKETPGIITKRRTWWVHKILFRPHRMPG